MILFQKINNFKNIKIIEMDYNNFNIKVWNKGECKDLKGQN